MALMLSCCGSKIQRASTGVNAVRPAAIFFDASIADRDAMRPILKWYHRSSIMTTKTDPSGTVSLLTEQRGGEFPVLPSGAFDIPASRADTYTPSRQAWDDFHSAYGAFVGQTDVFNGTYTERTRTTTYTAGSIVEHWVLSEQVDVLARRAMLRAALVALDHRQFGTQSRGPIYSLRSNGDLTFTGSLLSSRSNSLSEFRWTDTAPNPTILTFIADRVQWYFSSDYCSFLRTYQLDDSLTRLNEATNCIRMFGQVKCYDPFLLEPPDAATFPTEISSGEFEINLTGFQAPACCGQPLP